GRQCRAGRLDLGDRSIPRLNGRVRGLGPAALPVPDPYLCRRDTARTFDPAVTELAFLLHALMRVLSGIAERDAQRLKVGGKLLVSPCDGAALADDLHACSRKCGFRVSGYRVSGSAKTGGFLTAILLPAHLQQSPPQHGQNPRPARGRAPSSGWPRGWRPRPPGRACWA